MAGTIRYTMLDSTKSSTVGGGRIRHVVIRHERYGSAAEPLKFVVLRPSGMSERGEVHLPLGDVKKSSKRLRPVERRLRKLIRAEYRALGEYLDLHDQARRKRRNGWLKDLRKNFVTVLRHRT
jgi:Family of unknown function (DUF6312)